MQENIFDYETILGILNRNGIHWTLMVSTYTQHALMQMCMDLKEHVMVHLDPLTGNQDPEVVDKFK